MRTFEDEDAASGVPGRRDVWHVFHTSLFSSLPPVGGRTPEETRGLISRAMSRGDADAALACYEPTTLFVSADGDEVISGRDGAYHAFTELLRTKPELTSEERKVLIAGDIALVISDWALEGRDVDGRRFTQRGTSTDVMRCQADGTWLCVIDNPSGVD